MVAQSGINLEGFINDSCVKTDPLPLVIFNIWFCCDDV